MEVKFCWRCGVGTIKGANFCHSCGNGLSHAAPSAAILEPRTDPTELEGFSKIPLPELVEELLGVKLPAVTPRFDTPGWRYQGQANLHCPDCGAKYQVFRKPYQTTKGDYEYWGIICPVCGTCHGLDVLDEESRKALRGWSKSASGKPNPEASHPPRPGANRSDSDRRSPRFEDQSNAPKPVSSKKQEEILPLPGDPGATRRPGKKREHYRTGEEAELRHIARKHKWWE